MDLKVFCIIVLLLMALGANAYEYKNNSRTGKPDMVTTNFSDMKNRAAFNQISGIPLGRTGTGVCWKSPIAFGHFSSDGTCN